MHMIEKNQPGFWEQMENDLTGIFEKIFSSGYRYSRLARSEHENKSRTLAPGSLKKVLEEKGLSGAKNIGSVLTK